MLGDGECTILFDNGGWRKVEAVDGGEALKSSKISVWPVTCGIGK